MSDSFWTHERGLKSWLLTRDHKRIGILYLGTVLVFLLLGGIFALVLRLSLVTPNNALVDAHTYDKLFTQHGIVMVWLFMIPSIPSAFGNFLLPLMLGARDVAFPRLNLASYWIFVTGGIVVCVALIAGGVDTGWTFYTPYSTASPTAT
ncbi:MAG TPA: cbb3-type cytochrome c oxidase subunit I, partial [Kofleriaceae bacterium]|nr:cbb3-type cytochrome c oxidase subunit I [Kofleriaceae bacterium]